ncbi:GH92 family glycosyl hydrolase [Micromonospora sp. SL1-18]|uniref:GH92 family glycosyl hydrolase n=1 Tax=Micromonospora sp. SL1-18 TaxID=3399128 RepID=UPI003A4D43EA
MPKISTLHALLTVPVAAALVLPTAGTTSASEISAANDPPTSYVNPFIGTDPAPDTGYGGNFDAGDVFPGATYPAGMLAWSPDTAEHNIPGGYWYPDRTIKGFSLTHFSGRGCTAYQDVPIMPVNGPVTSSPPASPTAFRSTFSHDNEEAHPGYYRVGLDSGIDVKLAATPRTGSGEFTFPDQSDSSLIVNAGGSVNGTTSTDVTIDVKHQLVTGSAVSKVGCGNERYTIYFAVQFDRPFKAYGTWDENTLQPGSSSAKNAHTGAFLTFDTSGHEPDAQRVRVKPAISYVSVENALLNLRTENPGWSLPAARNKADKAWNDALGHIRVSGGSGAELTKFYTALYHTFFHPNIFEDVNGEYIGFDDEIHTVPSGRHQYHNIPGWDQYRTFISLRAMITPDEASDIIRSMVDNALQGGGGMPRWQQANRNSNGMVGDSPPAYVANAYAFGATDFDTKAALHALDLAASMPGTKSGPHDVREHLTDWLQLGYIPNKPSITLEYATDDFALAMFAEALGDSARHDKYLARAMNWKNTFNDATGYVEPRDATGNFPATFDPGNKCCGLVEGNAAQYTWMVPFDYSGLFAKLGGVDKTLARLDDFFTHLNVGPNRPYMWIGNEQNHNSPWEYAFAGAPAKAQQVARRIQQEAFSPQPNGLPGNDDAGATSSWYVLSALGLFPAIPGVSGVVVGSPVFPEATVDMEHGHVLRILGRNAATDHPYVKSLQVTGEKWESPWIPWSRLAKGGTVDFTLGGEPTDWGTDPTQAPPSWDGEPPTPPGRPTYDSLAQAFDNVGISPDSDPACGDFSGSHTSYSADALAAAGLTPGGTVEAAGLTFRWPDSSPCQPDNVIAEGQIILMEPSPGATTLGFLGASANGAASGSVVITYTDGTSTTKNVTFAAWQRGPGSSNITVATIPYRNGKNGPLYGTTYVYATTVPIDPSKTVKTITLPNATNDKTTMHIFAMAAD